LMKYVNSTGPTKANICYGKVGSICSVTTM